MPKRTTSSARDLPWCKECDAQFLGACVDAGHQPFSAKMLREDQSAGPIRQLELGVAASDQLLQHIQRFADAAAEEAGRNEASNKQLRDHLQRLREVTTSGVGFDEAIRLSQEAVDEVPELQRRAALLASEGRLRVTLERAAGATLEARVRLAEGDDLSLARLLLLQLLDAEELKEVTDDVMPSSSGDTQPQLLPFDFDLSRVPAESIQLLLGEASGCRQIRKLTCGDAEFIDSLLKPADLATLLAKAEHLEELQLPRPRLATLSQISTLTALRRLELTLVRWPISEHSVPECVPQYPALPPGLVELRLAVDNADVLRILESAPPTLRVLTIKILRWQWWSQEDGNGFPGLPATIETLRMEDLSTNYLVEAACRLPRLRELTLLCTKFVHDFAAPPPTPPGEAAGVQRLEVHSWCKDTLQALVAAHAATITQLGVHTDLRPRCCLFPLHGDLGPRLKSMELPALRRLILHRPLADRHCEPHPDSPDEEGPARDACRIQLASVRSAVRPGVEVVCSVCDSGLVHAPLDG